MNVQKIKGIFNRNGAKNMSSGIKKDKELYQWLLNETKDYPNINVSERAYIVVNNFDPICPNGNKRSFISFTNGYNGGCGRAASCQCVRESVSESVKKKKAKFTKEQIDAANKKREATSLKNYGVTNNGQTKAAKDAHKAFYANEDNVKSATEKYITTMFKRYGVANPANLKESKDKKKATNLERYEFESAMQHPDISKKSGQNRKDTISRIAYEANFERIKTRFSEDYDLEILMKPEEYTGVTSIKKLDVRCRACSREFKTGLDYGGIPVCKVCYPTKPKYQSREELEVFNFIKEHYDGKVIGGDRTLINPYELDIYMPDLNLAIEYCGLYWHSEEGGKDKTYHRNKFLKCEEKGVQLITIFADEWNNKREICKSRLLNHIGKSQNKIGARKLVIKEVGGSESASFLRENHIQGQVASQVKVGLFLNNELVSLMTFGKMRAMMNQTVKDGSWEMLRFVNKRNWNVPGAASRLLKYFEKNYNPNSLTSFADLRWSNGHLYQVLGFDNQKSETPGYSYTLDCLSRISRQSLTKAKLVSLGMTEDMTEEQGRILLGYKKIWDCGNRKYVKTY